MRSKLTIRYSCRRFLFPENDILISNHKWKSCVREMVLLVNHFRSIWPNDRWPSHSLYLCWTRPVKWSSLVSCKKKCLRTQHTTFLFYLNSVHLFSFNICKSFSITEKRHPWRYFIVSVFSNENAFAMSFTFKRSNCTRTCNDSNISAEFFFAFSKKRQIKKTLFRSDINYNTYL